MTHLQIVCDNCGAKYRLPETFAGQRAKCKQCGSAIDVAAQRQAGAAPAAPAAAKPAAARPASARPAASASSASRRERDGRASRSSERSSERGRRGKGKDGQPAAGGKHNKVAIASIVLLLVVTAVGVVWYLNSSKVNKGHGTVPPAGQPADANADKSGTPQPATGHKGDAAPAPADGTKK